MEWVAYTVAGLAPVVSEESAVTLAEVAAKVRQQYRGSEFTADGQRYVEMYIDRVAKDFEADPDFTLRERVEKLAKWAAHTAGGCAPGSVERDIYSHVAFRLGEVLEGKP